MEEETVMTSGKVSFLFNPGHHKWEESNILPRSACGGRKQSPSCLCICKFTLPRCKTMGTKIVKHGQGGGGMAAAQTKANLGGIEEASRSNEKWGRVKEWSPIFVFPHVLKVDVYRCMCKCSRYFILYMKEGLHFRAMENAPFSFQISRLQGK